MGGLDFSGSLSCEDPEKPGNTGEMEQLMKVSVKVKQGALTRQVSVTTHSIERALQLSGANLPGTEARVLFPIDPEEFFCGGFDQDSPNWKSLDPHSRLLDSPDPITEVAA